MNKRKWSKSALLVAVFSIILIGFQQLAFCTSGGGGDGGGGGNGGGGEQDEFSNLASYQGAASTLLSELSFDEIKSLMYGLNADVRSQLLDDYVTWPPGTTVKQLIDLIDTGVPVSKLTEKERDSLLVNLDERTRNYLLIGWEHWTKDANVADIKGAIERWSEGNRVRDNRDANLTDKAATIVEFLDWGGKKTQFVLGFCPGVGLATSVILDTTRAAADARKEGKDTSKIAEAAAVKGTVSFLFNYFSKADGILETAVEGEAGSALEKSANITAEDIEKTEIAVTFLKDMVYGMPKRQNKVTKPSYSSSGGFGPGKAQRTQHTAQ